MELALETNACIKNHKSSMPIVLLISIFKFLNVIEVEMKENRKKK